MNIVDKIEKLQRMADSGGPEGDNAQRLIAILMNKHDIKASDIDEPRKHITYKTHRLKKFAMHLAAWMGVPLYSLRGRPDYIMVDANSEEYRMFHELLGEIKHHFNKMDREYAKTCYEDASELLVEKGYELEEFSEQMIKKIALKLKNDKLQSFMRGYMETNFAYDHNTCRDCKKGKLVENETGWICDNCGAQYKSSKFHGRAKDEGAFAQGVSTDTKSIKQSKLRIAG